MGAAIPAGVPSSCPPRPTRPTAPAQRSGGAAPHATAARSGPHARGPGGAPRAWPDHAGAEGPPNASFSSAAGRFAEARRATARDGVLKNAQVWGRASGVCCERGWAAGLAAGRRAGAHRTCGRGRGDTGRRTESCPPRPTQPTAPAQRSVRRAPHATAARSGPHAAALAARHPHGRTTLGLRDRPTPASAAPLAGALERGARRHEAALKTNARLSAAPAVSAASDVGLRAWGCGISGCPAARYARLSGMPGCPVCPAVRLSGCPVCPVCPAARYVRRVRLPGMPGCPVCPAVRYARLSGCPVCPAARLFDGALRVEGSPTPASAAPLAASVDRGARRHATAP